VLKVLNILTGVKVLIFELAAVGEYPQIMSAEPRGRCQVVTRAEAGGPGLGMTKPKKKLPAGYGPSGSLSDFGKGQYDTQVHVPL
jgi:hypothetical protein